MENSKRYVSPNIYMMIRPRGFGLSLAVEAIGSILERDSLLLRNDHDKEIINELPEHHVITLNLKKVSAKNPKEFANGLINRIQELYWEHHIESNLTPYMTPKSYFSALISALANRHDDSIVILIDNYDIPFIIASTMPEQYQHEAVSIYLDMLNVIKLSGHDVRWAMLSGHIKFPLASELSEGLPLVHDISYETKYETLFGFTKEEVENVFAEQIENLAPHQGLTASDFLYSLEQCYGGFCFSDSLKKVMCPACINHVLINDGMLYTYSASGDYSFLKKALQAEQNLSWLFDKDGQDPLFANSVDIKPKGKQIGSLLIQLGFCTRDKVTEHNQTGTSNWRYRFTSVNEDMHRTFKIVSGKAAPELQLQPINPYVVDAGDDEFDYEIDEDI